MKNNRKKVMILTNHSYMLYRFRKELIEELMKNYDVILSMPFVGHHEDFINMGLRCIETKMERRGLLILPPAAAMPLAVICRRCPVTFSWLRRRMWISPVICRIF